MGLTSAKAWTFDPMLTYTASLTVGSGVIYWAGIYLPTTSTISNVTMIGLTNAVGTFTYAGIGLYNSAGTLIGSNTTGVGSVLLGFSTLGWNTIALTATSAGSLTNLAPGAYAVAILQVGATTAPTILRTNQSGTSSAFLLNAGAPGGNSAQVRGATTSGASSLPSTAPAVTAYANSTAFWGLT